MGPTRSRFGWQQQAIFLFGELPVGAPTCRRNHHRLREAPFWRRFAQLHRNGKAQNLLHPAVSLSSTLSVHNLESPVSVFDAFEAVLALRLQSSSLN